jgi:hypothetical protein
VFHYRKCWSHGLYLRCNPSYSTLLFYHAAQRSPKVGRRNYDADTSSSGSITRMAFHFPVRKRQ